MLKFCCALAERSRSSSARSLFLSIWWLFVNCLETFLVLSFLLYFKKKGSDLYFRFTKGKYFILVKKKRGKCSHFNLMPFALLLNCYENDLLLWRKTLLKRSFTCLIKICYMSYVCLSTLLTVLMFVPLRAKSCNKLKMAHFYIILFICTAALFCFSFHFCMHASIFIL